MKKCIPIPAYSHASVDQDNCIIKPCRDFWEIVLRMCWEHCACASIALNMRGLQVLPRCWSLSISIFFLLFYMQLNFRLRISSNHFVICFYTSVWRFGSGHTYKPSERCNFEVFLFEIVLSSCLVFKTVLFLGYPKTERLQMGNRFDHRCYYSHQLKWWKRLFELDCRTQMGTWQAHGISQQIHLSLFQTVSMDPNY